MLGKHLICRISDRPSQGRDQLTPPAPHTKGPHTTEVENHRSRAVLSPRSCGQWHSCTHIWADWLQVWLLEAEARCLCLLSLLLLLTRSFQNGKDYLIIHLFVHCRAGVGAQGLAHTTELHPWQFYFKRFAIQNVEFPETKNKV